MCSPYSLKPRGGSRVWNEPTLLWNDLTIEMNDLTWSNLTIEENDRNRFKDNPYFLSDRIILVSKLLQDSITFFNNYSLWLILKTRAILSMKTKTTRPLRNFIDMFSCGIFLFCSNWPWCRITNFEASILIFLPYQRELHMRLSCWILRWYLQIR